MRSEGHALGPLRTNSEPLIATCRKKRWRARSRWSSQGTQALFLVTNQLLTQVGHSHSWAETTSRELSNWRLPEVTSCPKGSSRIKRGTMLSSHLSARSMAEITTSVRDQISTIPCGPRRADSHTGTQFWETNQLQGRELSWDSPSQYAQLTLRTMSRRTTSLQRERADLPATPFCSIRSKSRTSEALLPSSSAPAVELPSRNQRETLTCRGWCRQRRIEAGFIWKCFDV